MASLAVGLILEKIASKDKDFRYMATSDLLNELQKDTFKADPEIEKKVVQIVLQQLEDQSGDISGLAVKCLAPLVKKVNEARVVDMVKLLSGKLTVAPTGKGGKEQVRDIAGIALKTIVTEVHGPTATGVVETLTPLLVDAIEKDNSVEVKSDALDILSDVLHRFGHLVVPLHGKILAALLVQLASPKAGLRKRATTALATLAASLSDDLLRQATKAVVEQLKDTSLKVDMIRTYIQTIGSLSRSVGYRFGPHLSEVVLLLITYCKEASENDDELREYSLQALESFVLRCPRDVSEHTDAILNLALEFLSYDPNYSEDMDEDEEEGDEEEEEEEDEESADEYSDDEDVSWKVRRAAAKTLSAVITSRPEMIALLYQKACPELINRFKEREENVKIDLFNAFSDLLRQTGLITKGGELTPSSPLYLLQQEVPKLVRSLNKQLKHKSVKTRVGVFSVLRELVVVLPNSLADHFASLVPGIKRALEDRSSNSSLKIEALVFTRLVLSSHSPEVFQPHIKALSSPVLAAVGERYYKVTSEALRVTGELVKVIRPASGQSFAFESYVRPIYGAVEKRLTAQDQDQEVKESAIIATGLVISILGDKLQSELPTSLNLLLDRLRNEITRLTAVKALETIARSPLHVDLSPILAPAVAELTSFLRKANRALRLAALSTLDALATNYSAQLDAPSIEAIVGELSGLVSDSDLQMAASALSLCVSMVAKQPQAAGGAVRDKVLPQTLLLVRSSLLQGQALQTLQAFFAALVQSNTASFDSLLSALLASAKPQPSGSAAGSSSGITAPLGSPTGTGPAGKQAYHSVAQCVAVLCTAAGDAKVKSTVETLIKNLRDSGAKGAEPVQLLSLLALGEIGRRRDLSKHADVEGIVTSAFGSPSEEIKAAASYSLGNIAVGNLHKYLGFILAQIDAQPKQQYLLLHSLKEVIARQPVHVSRQVELQSADVDKILRLLFSHCESEEEGVRNVVAECLGKLALIEPARIVPDLQEHTKNPSAFTRATVVTALKFTIVEGPQAVDSFIQASIAEFLSLIEDSDRHVRRATVSALSTAAHNKAGLVADHLPGLLPKLYDLTLVKKELIRVVDLGPFKHTIDDGLEIRKTAFECMDTLLDACLDRIDPSRFINPYLVSGLGDHADVKMPCHLILSKLAVTCGPAVVAELDALVEPLQATVTKKVKTDAVKQEVDRNEDMIRSALRAIHSLAKIPDAETSSAKFKTFLSGVVRTGTLAEKFNAVQHESDTLVATDAMDAS